MLRERILYLRSMLMLLDVAALTLSFIAAYLVTPLVRYVLIGGEHWWALQPFGPYLMVLAAVIPLWLLLYEKNRLYKGVEEKDALGLLTQCVIVNAIGLLLLSFPLFFGKMQFVSRLLIFHFVGFNTVSLFLTRIIFREEVERARTSEEQRENVLILGSRERARKAIRYFKKAKDHFRVLGCAELDASAVGECVEGTDVSVISTVGKLGEVVKRHAVDRVVVAIPTSCLRDFGELMTRMEMLGLNVDVLPERAILEFEAGETVWKTSLDGSGGLPALAFRWVEYEAGELVVKRLIDLAGSIVLLILLSPLFAVIAALIKYTSPGPVFYKSMRLGKGRKVFDCYKFRTMVADADERKQGLRHLNEKQGPFFKIADDPRLTRVGKFLRKYSLDELPQLWNVLKGDMSLVGPRPHPLDDFEQYSPDHIRRLKVTPGLTSLWAVEARSDPSFERNMELDLHYIRNWSLGLDMSILFRTVGAVLRGEGQ